MRATYASPGQIKTTCRYENDLWREGADHVRGVWRSWAMVHINCHYTYTSNLYMYIVAISSITFKFKFTHKLLLVQNIVKTYTSGVSFYSSCHLEHNSAINYRIRDHIKKIKYFLVLNFLCLKSSRVHGGER